LTAFEKGAVLPRYLGEHYHQVFARCRWEERDRFNAAVSDQDYQWYLRGA
jgi:glutamine synthetase